MGKYWIFCFGSVVLTLTTLPGLLFAQTPEPNGPPSYQQLRYDEDYSYLRNPARRSDSWDVIKYMPLKESGDWYASLGGEARLRYEYFRNPSWGQQPQDDSGYVLQRYMLHTDLRMGKWIRLFGQIKSGLETGRVGGPRPTDEDELDLHQLFMDISMGTDNENQVTVRAGRQEMAYGSARLVSVREEPNVRRSFDGLRAILKTGAWRVDSFGTRPVETDRGIFDDGSQDDQSFWGVYAVGPMPVVSGLNIDLYYLGLDRKDASFDQGTAREKRHSVGTRLWGEIHALDYNFEVIYQWGNFGDGHIQAWTMASDTGYTLSSAPLRPRIGLKADIASGDRDPADQDLETFNALFPKGAYFGQIALIGPANFMDLHPSLGLQIIRNIAFTTDWDFFWRQSTSDGIYGSGGNLLRSGQTSQARYIGSQLSSEVKWQVDRHLSVASVYTHFFPGSFLEETQPGESVDYVTTWVTYKF